MAGMMGDLRVAWSVDMSAIGWAVGLVVTLAACLAAQLVARRVVWSAEKKGEGRVGTWGVMLAASSVASWAVRVVGWLVGNLVEQMVGKSA